MNLALINIVMNSPPVKNMSTGVIACVSATLIELLQYVESKMPPEYQPADH